MSSFETILNKLYPSSAQLEQDAYAAATREGFVLTKFNTDYVADGLAGSGSIPCVPEMSGDHEGIRAL